MNFRILAGSVRPRGQAVALLAASALSATLIVSGAQAQAPGAGCAKGGAEGCSETARASAGGAGSAGRVRAAAPSPRNSRCS